MKRVGSFVGSRGSYARDFLGKGRGFEDMS